MMGEYARPSWLNTEEPPRSRFEEFEFEDAEAFTFEPTAALTDFNAALRKAWHKNIELIFTQNITTAVGGIAGSLKISTAAAAKHLRFFSPAATTPSVKLTDANVLWRALPTSFGTPSTALLKALDEQELQETELPSKFMLKQMLRKQDEYCEWKVFRNSAKKIERVVFSSEPPEYYQFLYDPGVASLKKAARALLVKLYQLRCGNTGITLADLETNASGTAEYNPGNKWNNEHCVHLQQPDNTLLAQVNIASLAAIVLADSSGALITDVQRIIRTCIRFGEPNRQSDPTIGDNANRLARENRFFTLENPVGLYMTELDTSGWTTPDGTDAQKFWKVLRGKTDKDPRKSMIVRAEFAVPAGVGYTVSDIKIAGVPIEFGGQIAEHLEMRLGARFGPKDKDLKGGKLSAPTPLVC